MASSFSKRLYYRELDDIAVRSHTYRRLYGDQRLISDLDIVNELDGHSGCVNALSWSKSGNLLASGSDDQHLNIHTYQPASANNQFQLTATVATGHTQNIFSVKFMPHSNDKTVITAAGDGEVRIFDLEYAGQSTTASSASAIASEGRRRGRNQIFDGVNYMSDGNTNCRVYRSHGDRVKRIVTESSPYLFLTCSEDGEVRQWDLRQPSSAYPAPHGNRYGPDTSVPAPLISYKRYGLDLNTISCSASQPHYIALGGAHLHAFLHDRRMTGRDRLLEAGQSLPPIDQMSQSDEELLSQATQCVRKFAPGGQRRMRRADNGHITACKISDARPDEMIVSWSGDHIYSFDLVRCDPAEEEEPFSGSRRAKQSQDRKRKRKENSSVYRDQASSRLRTSMPQSETALRIRYQNGQSEEIPIPVRDRRGGTLTERQQMAQRLAKGTAQIRSSLFSLHAPASNEPPSQFTAALGYAASIITDMDEAMREWGYPLDPSPIQVVAQQMLRRQRESSRRFVQAAGTLARLLGGQLQTPSGGTNPLAAHFSMIETRNSELELSLRERFGYDFLKAIVLWLDSGIGCLIDGFTRPTGVPLSTRSAARLPIPESEASIEAIDEHLVPYLLSLASDNHAIVNLDVNRFEVDDNRCLYASEAAAVRAFADAVKMPFADLSFIAGQKDRTEQDAGQDRRAALDFWAGHVARGALLNTIADMKYAAIDRAFGGLGRSSREFTADEGLLDELRITRVDDETTLLNHDPGVHGQSNGDSDNDQFDNDDQSQLIAIEDEGGDVIAGDHSKLEVAEDDSDDYYEDADDAEDISMNEDREDFHSDTSSELDEIDGVPNTGNPSQFFRSAFERRRLRPKVEPDTLCVRPTRTYSGHCNVRTVKDVNYFGPDDQYVVSGSDDGNFFIWDRKTSKLVNLLEGDGEVVNVIQGHPYETMLAVSGIDHTIKIFSPDARSRDLARLGQGVFAHDDASFSSLQWPSRIGSRRTRHSRSQAQQGEAPDGDLEASATLETGSSNLDFDLDDQTYVAPHGLGSRRRMHDAERIMRQNDRERQGRDGETVITLPQAQLLQLLFGHLGNMTTFP